MKINQGIHKPEIPDGTGAKKWDGVQVLWHDHNPPLLKSGHCGNNVTQLNTPKNQFKKVWITAQESYQK